MDAIFYVSRTGCQWKALDAAPFCSGRSAHRRFRQWGQAGVFERLWPLGLLEHDALQGMDWSWLAMDGAMSEAPLGGKKTGPNPKGRAKCDTERSLLTEGAGVPLAVTVDGANRNDFRMTRVTLGALQIERPAPSATEPQGVCLDKGDDYAEVRALLSESGCTAHIRARGEEVRRRGPSNTEVGVRARRWVVARAHSWLNLFRRVRVRWDKKSQN